MGHWFGLFNKACLIRFVFLIKKEFNSVLVQGLSLTQNNLNKNIRTYADAVKQQKSEIYLLKRKVKESEIKIRKLESEIQSLKDKKTKFSIPLESTPKKEKIYNKLVPKREPRVETRRPEVDLWASAFVEGKGFHARAKGSGKETFLTQKCDRWYEPVLPSKPKVYIPPSGDVIRPVKLPMGGIPKVNNLYFYSKERVERRDEPVTSGQRSARDERDNYYLPPNEDPYYVAPQYNWDVTYVRNSGLCSCHNDPHTEGCRYDLFSRNALHPHPLNGTPEGREIISQVGRFKRDPPKTRWRKLAVLQSRIIGLLARLPEEGSSKN
jgi:hypothetical protein